MPIDSPSAPAKEAPRLFPLFSLLWGLASLVHQTASSFWMDGWAGWLLVIAAFAVVFEPRCLVRFTAMVIVSLLNLYQKLPFVPNHILFEGMLHLTMLIGLIELALRLQPAGSILAALRPGKHLLALAITASFKTIYLLNPGLNDNLPLGAATTFLLAVAFGCFVFRERAISDDAGEKFIARLAPVIRLALVVLYFWSVIQKLNRDYLDPAVSCAVTMNAEIAANFPFIPYQGWVLPAMIWGTFVIELAIPALLLIPGTRLLGFISAVAFHFWVAIHANFGIYSFSSLAFGVLALFLSGNSVTALEELWRRQLEWLGGGNRLKGRGIARWTVLLVYSGAMISQALCYLLLGRSLDVFWTANRIGFWLFTLYSAWLCISYFRVLTRSQRGSRGILYRAKPTWAWLGLLLVIGNGVSPWVGLKTQTSFSMYSNLRSEGEGNHLFLERADLFSYQTDMVELIESEPDLLAIGSRPRGIQQFANPGRIFPWFELRRLVSESEGDLRLTYTRGDKTLEASRVGGEITGDAELFQRHPRVLSKVLWFRRHLSLEGPMHCTH